MSKLSFRARALDPSKPLNIHIAEELPDLTEYSAINRAVPQMPSGMEKEEESEHHLQRAICTGLIIPTPEVFDIDQEFYDRIYPEDFKVSRQLIRMQPLGIEQDIPDYDMDSADEEWINSQTRRFELPPLKFEEMMDCLEKSSGQTVVTLNEAKALLKQDDEISIAVYDYWLNKRLNTQHPLILTIKTENRAGTAVNNPYIAFRRRTEKMQTRKNRKNDETSYEKMLKLKRNLTRAVALLEMIKKREKTKREHVHLGIEIFEKRFQAKDFNGFLLAEYTNNAIKSSRSAFAPLYGNQFAGPQSSQYWSNSSAHYHGGNATGMQTIINKHGNSDIDGGLHNSNRKEKRQYKKRKHKNQREKLTTGSTIDHLVSSDEDEPIINLNHIGHDSENEGLYPFRRSSSNQYHKPLINDYGSWPWDVKTENSAKYRFTLTSIKHPRVRCIGFARRRRGRGGRIVLDRISTNMDEFWANLDYTIYSGDTKITAKEICEQNELQKRQSADALTTDSVVVDLEPSNKLSATQHNGIATSSSCDGYENIVIKTEEKTGVTVNDCPDIVNRSVNSSSYAANTFYDIKRNHVVNSGATVSATLMPTPTSSSATITTMDTKTNRNNSASVNLINTDSNNNSGNNNSSSKKNTSNKSSSSSRLSNLSARRLSTTPTANSHRFNLPHSSLSSTSSAAASLISSALPCTSSNMPSMASQLQLQLQQQPSALHANRNAPATSMSVVTDIEAPLSASALPAAGHISLLRSSSDPHMSDGANELSPLQPPHGGFDDDKTITNQLYSELFGDWLHFRPKTPDDDIDMCNFGEDFPQFAESSSLTVDIQRLTTSQCPDTIAGHGRPDSLPSTSIKSVIDQNIDHTFTTSPFSYEYLVDTGAGRDELSRPSNVSDADSVHAFDDASSMDELNLSGDSLPGGALSLGDNEANDRVIDKLLEDCKFEDLKSINTNTFWNGLLDENGSLLDVIDTKKVNDLGITNFLSTTSERRVRQRGHPVQHIGCSSFSLSRSHEFSEREVLTKSEPNQGSSGEISGGGAAGDQAATAAAAGTSSMQHSSKKPAERLEANAMASTSTAQAVPSTSSLALACTTMSAMAPASMPNNVLPKIHIKEETIDETIVPVTKTDIGNNVSFVPNTAIQRPIQIQQTAQLQQQPHQAASYAGNDQTLILSSRPIRRIQTANGPADGKSGIQHLLINRKFQMIPQRTISDDDKDVKPKIIEGTYLKLPPDFNVVSTSALTTIHSSNATSKHNYSLPPQATFHQPITLIGQSQQSQNKVIINPSHIGTTNLALATQSMSDMQNKITIPMSIPTSLNAQTSNIKLNLVPSLAQMMQSGGGIVIDAKSVQNSVGGNEQSVSSSSATTSAANVAQIHYQHQMQPQSQAAQMQSQQSQQVHAQPKVKLEKTVNMMYADADRTRILYNLKNNRAGAQFLAQLNPAKVVNIVPFQQHKGGPVQGLVNKSIQRVVVSSSQSQQLANVFRQQNAGATTADGGQLLSGGGNVSSTAANSNNIIGSVVGGGTQGGTLIITTSAAQSDPSLYTSDINSTAITSTNTNSINSNANNNQTLNMGNLTKAAAIDKSSDGRLNHNDGNVTTINR